MYNNISIFSKYPGLGHLPYEKGQPWNLGVVDKGKVIYRGAAPANKGVNPLQSLSWLKNNGVKTILILNKTEQGIDLDEELNIIRKLGLKVKCFDWQKMYQEKINGYEPILDKYLELFEEGRLYIHCIWGVDRTGSTIARARRKLYDWSSLDAFLELRAYGFAFEFPAETLHEYQKEVMMYFDFDINDYEPLTPGHPDHTACIVREETKIG